LNQLTTTTQNLPSKIEDLSQFVLVGREKLVSVRAEIRAIDKLNLAAEVRDQKREECSMLAEALLDAEIKIGEFTKQISKAKNQYGSATDSGVDSVTKKMVSDTGVTNQKPKHEVIEGLGFSTKQAERFETLADNKDIVEVVKQEARDNDDIPTRSRVLDLVKQKKQIEQKKAEQKEPDDYKEYCQYIDECKKIATNLNNFLLKCFLIDTDDETLNKWKEFLKDKDDLEDKLESVNIAIPKLLKIQKFLKKEIDRK
jgi:hypothetical protein